MSGILYRPLLSRTPMSIGSPLQGINTSSSLGTVTPSFVKMESVPSSDVLPTLMSDDGKCWKVSAFVARFESWGNGNCVTLVAVLVSPLATRTVLVDRRRMGKPASFLSSSLM